jgi:hypothetical protein
MDPVPGLQRAAVPGRQGSRSSHAAARHPAHLPDILPLPHLRPGVLARRPLQAPRADHRLSSPRRQSPRKPVRAHSGRRGISSAQGDAAYICRTAITGHNRANVRCSTAHFLISCEHWTDSCGMLLYLDDSAQEYARGLRDSFHIAE